MAGSQSINFEKNKFEKTHTKSQETSRSKYEKGHLSSSVDSL